jgi:hypothetical protein
MKFMLIQMLIHALVAMFCNLRQMRVISTDFSSSLLVIDLGVL